MKCRKRSEVWESVLGCKGNVGMGVGKCVRVLGEVRESVLGFGER